MSLLLLLPGYAPTIPNHWYNVRPGDPLPVMLPFAGGFCGHVRLLSMTYREDGDGLLEVETQWLEPVTVETPLRFIAEGGAVPPPVVAAVSQVAEQLTAVSKEQAAQNQRLNEMEQQNADAVPKDRLSPNVVAAINASAGGIEGDKLSDVRATSDPGGVASAIQLTNVDNTGTGRSSGVGTVKFADATNRDNSGFVKIWIGTTAFYVPVWTAN